MIRSIGRTAALSSFACAAVLASAACSGSGPQPHDVTAANGSATPTANASATPTPAANPLTFESVVTPPDALDGALADWAERSGGADNVSVAVTEKGITFGGELDAGYARGVLFTVGSKVAALPMIGEPTRGGGYQELDCVHERDYIEGEYIATDKPLKPEIAAECRKFVAAYEKQKTDHAARFTRSIAIDEKGLSAIDDKGARTPIAGAKAVWKTKEGGAITFEAFLPAIGMPRLSESPLMGLYVLAAPATNGAPPKVIPEMEPLALAPVSFGPHSDVRSFLFVMYNEPHYVGDEFVDTAGFSYAPADPAHVESWHHESGGEAIAATVDTLYEPVLKVGDIEIGTTNVHSQYLSIVKNGELLDLISPPAPVKKILERDGEIHIIGYQEGGYSMMIGPKFPEWMIAIVDANGSVRDGLASAAFSEARDANHCGYSIDSVAPGKPANSEKWDQLDWTGSCVTSEPGDAKVTEAGLSVTLKWDAKKKTYVGTHKKIPVPKHPKTP